MDSTAIAAIQDNTAAIVSLTGSLWAITGFATLVAIGLYALSQTIHGR